MAVELLTGDERGLARAAEHLRVGAVVGFPTDTVYGLAVLASDPLAVRRVFQLKQRPLGRPLVVMIADAGDVEQWAAANPRARRFMDLYWPGPLTLVLPARPGLRAPLTAGRPPTIAVRIPEHPLARRLLEEAGEALATTSANLSGQPPAQSAGEAARLEGLAAVLDGGPAPGGVPSTVLDLTGARPRILREGGLPAADLLDL